jgi:hypothetical protein
VIIHGVDPGKMTGLFVFESPGKIIIATEMPALEATHEVHRLMEIRPNEHHHIHAERFVMQAGKQTQQPDALEQIGALRWIADLLGATFKLHSRSVRARITREQLVRIGWWEPGLDHVNQAARCALLGLITHDPNHDLVKQAFGTI